MNNKCLEAIVKVGTIPPEKIKKKPPLSLLSGTLNKLNFIPL